MRLPNKEVFPEIFLHTCTMSERRLPLTTNNYLNAMSKQREGAAMADDESSMFMQCATLSG